MIVNTCLIAFLYFSDGYSIKSSCVLLIGDIIIQRNYGEAFDVGF